MTAPASNGAGVFITFEGADGVGKSTQARLLCERLTALGNRVLATREPGGAPGADDIRALVVNGAVEKWTPLSEALLMSAARSEHLTHTIRPALARGEIVVCDRFSDSTMAYQGYAGGVGRDAIDRINAVVVGDDMPALTLILSGDPAEGLMRACERAAGDGAGENTEQRFEAKGGAFQKAVHDAFLDIAARAPDRCVLIDAAGTREAVAARIATAVAQRFAQFKVADAGGAP